MYNLSFFLTIFSDRAASTAEGFPDIFEGIPNIFGVDCDIDAHSGSTKPNPPLEPDPSTDPYPLTNSDPPIKPDPPTNPDPPIEPGPQTNLGPSAETNPHIDPDPSTQSGKN